MAERFAELTGFVLAGGASRRMGQPKHELILEGETLLMRSVRRARSVAGRVCILGPKDRARGMDLIALPDELPGSGPLGAIYTGLNYTRTEFNLFLSCDVPFIEVRLLRYLARQAIASAADVTLAETPHHGYQTLSAVYRRRTLPAVRRNLATDRNKIASFFPKVHVRVLRWPELARAGFKPSSFDNLNTIEDYERAVIKTQESEDRSLKSGARSQESAVRRQESEVKEGRSQQAIG
jgi:molybdenum cofactor guanylyltransferase